MQLFAESKIVYLEVVSILLILVDYGNIDLACQLPVMTHCPTETGSNVNKEIILPTVVHVSEVETDSRKEINARSGSLTLRLTRHSEKRQAEHGCGKKSAERHFTVTHCNFFVSDYSIAKLHIFLK